MTRREFLRAGAGALAAAAVGQAATRPNIILIYADDIGYGDLSCNGATAIRTPNLDRIAADGVRFTDAHCTAATCTPSRYSLLTGEYAFRNEGARILPGDAPLLIDPGAHTLPEMLRKQGYRTGVVGKWHLGLGRGQVDWNGEINPGPRHIGFDYSFLIPATGDRVPCVYVENHRVVDADPADPIRVDYRKPIGNEPTGAKNPELLKVHPSHGHDMAIVNGVSRIGYMSGGKKALWVDEDMAGTITRKAVDFIERERKGPFFLYFATHDIHVPRVPHPRFAGKSGMGPRGDAILQLDWCAGEVLAALKKQGLERDTIVMFSSDNGPVIDDGYKDQAVEKLGAHKPAGPYRGGKYSNFEAGTRVPLLVRWPARIKPGQVSGALISQVDLLASFAAITGHKLPAGSAPDSFDLSAELLGESRKGREYLVEQAGLLSLREGRWKAIPPGKGPKINRNTNTEMGNDAGPQLYDLETDPGEKENLAARRPEVVKAMLARLEKIRAAATRPH